MLNDFKYYRQALGINMLWNSFPIIFFVRDGLGIGPQGSIFTFTYWIIGLLLMWPGSLFSRLYAPNKLLLFFWGGFLMLCMIYWKYYAPNGVADGSREIMTYILPFAFLFLLMYYPDDKVDCILIVMVGYTLVASSGLIYSIATNPTWHFGERAGINYKAMQGHSNPHAYANSALATILASAILLWKTRSTFKKLLYIFAIVFSLAVIVLCRTNTSLITLAVMAAIAFVFNGRSIIASTFSAKSLKIGFWVYAVVAFVLAQFSFIGYTLTVYSAAFAQRFNRVIYTISGAQIDQTESASIDHSSSYRLLSIERTKEFVFGSKTPIGEVLFGQGYKSVFLDMPSLDAIMNQGILGFIFYNFFWIGVIFTMIQQYFRPANNVSLFIAYLALLQVLSLFSGGQTIDLSAWLLQAFYIRFLGVYASKPALSLQTV